MTTLAALLIVILQCAIILLLLSVVRTFGEYTQIVERCHNSNRRLHEQAVEVLQRAVRLHSPPTTEDSSI